MENNELSTDFCMKDALKTASKNNEHVERFGIIVVDASNLLAKKNQKKKNERQSTT